MQPQTRALPHADLAALLGLVSILDAHLVGGELPADLTQDLMRRLTGAGSTAGTLNATLSDLAQRLHWAMSTDLEFPVPMPHRTTYQLSIPAGSVAACVAALREAGAEEVHSPDGRTVTAAFPELAPDPAYQERIAQLSALAERHGGEYSGAGW